jgi:hypothetical protein
MRSFFAGSLHSLRPPPDRSTTGRPSIDEAIRSTWAAYSAGTISWEQAAARDAELRRRQAAIVTPFRSAWAWRPRFF